MSYSNPPNIHSHFHRNSFSAATYTHHYGAPPQNPYRPSTAPRSSAYEGPWPIYALDWCPWLRPDARGSGKIALGSLSDDTTNRLQVLVSGDDCQLQRLADLEIPLPYPVTKVKWEPQRIGKPDANMLATSGDCLRLFSVVQGDPRLPGKIVQDLVLGNVRLLIFILKISMTDYPRLEPITQPH